MPDLKGNNYDIITLQNIDSEDFVFEYAKSEGNPPYNIPAGEVKRFPRFLAEHALKHLIDKILTKQKQKINNQEARMELASQIVIDEETFQSPVVKSEAERQREMVEELNKPSELDTILAKNKARLKADEPPAPTETPKAPQQEEKFEGLNEGEEPIKGDEVDTTKQTTT